LEVVSAFKASTKYESQAMWLKRTQPAAQISGRRKRGRPSSKTTESSSEPLCDYEITRKASIAQNKAFLKSMNLGTLVPVGTKRKYKARTPAESMPASRKSQRLAAGKWISCCVRGWMARHTRAAAHASSGAINT
jgi:hypothetical protein